MEQDTNVRIRVTLDTSDLPRSSGKAKDAINDLGNHIKRTGQGTKGSFSGLDIEVRTVAQNAAGHLSRYIGPAAMLTLGAGAARSFYQGFNDAIARAGKLQTEVAKSLSIKPSLDTTQFYKDLSELQTRVPKTAAEMAEAAYDIFSSIEVTQAEALKLVEKFSKGASAAVTDTKTWGTAVMGVMNAYKLEVKDVDHIQDVFFNTIKSGVVNGQELASSLGVVTQAAKNAGVNLDQMGALIAAVTKEGGNASQNINNLANTLQKLPTKETVKAMDALGVSVLDANKNFRPILEVLKDLDAKLKTMSQGDRSKWLQAIFPDAQARTGLQTILSQLQFVEDQLKVNQTEAGAAGTAYQSMAMTYEVAAKLQENSMHRLQEAIGELIITHPAYIEAMKITTEQINGVTDATINGGTETEKFGSDTIKTWAKIKANIVPFTGFLINMVQLVANSLGLILGSVSVVVTKMFEIVTNGIKNAVQGAINLVVDGLNKVTSIANSLGPLGANAVGLGSIVGAGKIERYNSPDIDLTSNAIATLKETQSALGENYRAMKAFATEGGAARDRIDASVNAHNDPAARAERERLSTERRRMDEERIARARQLGAEAEERIKKLGDRTSSGAPDPSGTRGRSKSTPNITDDADKFSISEFKDINERFRSLTGRNIPTSVIGQGKIHNQRGWDHRNAVDAKLNPNSPDGRLLVQLLTEMGVPFIQSTGKESWSTGAHIHIGERSRAFGKNVKSLAVNRDHQDNIKYIKDSQGNLVAVDMAQHQNVMADMRERMANTPIDAGAATVGGAITRKLNVDEQWRKPREDEQAARSTETLMRERNLAQEIGNVWRDVYADRKNLHMDTLIDIERSEQRLAGKIEDNANAEMVATRRTLGVRQEQEELYDRLTAAQDRMATMSENAALRMQVAYTEAHEDIQRRSVDAYERMARAQSQLEDSTVFHSEQMRAAVMDHAASAKSVTEIWSDAYVGAMDAVGDGISRVIGKLTDKLGVFGDIINDIASNLLKMVTNRLMMKLLDYLMGGKGGGVAGPAAGGAGITGAIMGGLGGVAAGGTPPFAGGGMNLLQGWLSRGVNGGAQMPAGAFFGSGAGVSQAIMGGVPMVSGPNGVGADFFSRSLTNQMQTVIQQRNVLADAVSQAGGAAAGGATATKGAAGAAGGMGAMLAQAAPLLGLGLGASLGGGSPVGTILGGAGGVIGGMLGGGLITAIGSGTFAGTTIGGWAGSLGSMLGGGLALGAATLGVGAAAALIGSLLIGRNQRRRQEETQRNTLAVGAREQVYELLRQAQAGDLTVEQARVAFEQIKKTYMDQANQLKDEKTRRHAILWWNDIQPVWNQIQAAALGVQDKKSAAERLRPEFADGGLVMGPLGSRQNIVAHAGEIIVNSRQQTPAVMAALSDAGMPSVRGAVARTSSGNQSGSGGAGNVPQVNVNISLGKQDQTEITINGIKSDKGRAALANTLRNIRKDGD